MELDLRFKQFDLTTEELILPQDENNKEEKQQKNIRPFQEVIDFFEENNKNFSYQNMQKILRNMNDSQHLTLKDGTQVFIEVNMGITNIGIVYPDQTRFVGCWTNIMDKKELIRKSFEIAQSKK